MLVSLHIENIAVIERADVTFDRGFNVLTGETGAGKSMVIDALNLVLGERVGRGIVRSGTEAALVTAVFDDLSEAVKATLGENGYEPEEDGTLLLWRQIGAEGRTVCRIGGRPATVAQLREIGRELVNIHGQHENQALLSPERHLDYLDRMGGLVPQRERYEVLYRDYCTLYRKLKAYNTDAEQKERRRELLRYQVQEIDDAALTAGEEIKLEEERQWFRHSEKILDSLTAAQQFLSGDAETDGGVALVSRAVREMMAAGSFSEALQQQAQRLEELFCELEETAQEVRQTVESLDFDGRRRDEVEQRLDLIRRLTAKYGPDTAAVLAYAEKARRELSELEDAEARHDEWEEQLTAAGKAAMAAAAELTKAREKAARHFSEQVAMELQYLDMPRVCLTVKREPISLTATGGDKIEFCLSANPGEEPRSIAKIASGGELSRIMLAMKAVMADADEIDTLVFDEIDTGISGHAARRVGEKLHAIARSSRTRRRQILCVTHLAQIAARGDRHLLIAKSVRNGRTYTEVTALSRVGRERELARIIGGVVTETTQKAAAELLDTPEIGQ